MTFESFPKASPSWALFKSAVKPIPIAKTKTNDIATLATPPNNILVSKPDDGTVEAGPDALINALMKSCPKIDERRVTAWSPSQFGFVD
ncbi:hypothetical protein PA3_34330 [Acinetobacter pittii]|uniref:Uncharacterized protein n=2 Tax=Acinetobacter calcoaceticus/baumannii complex TaxID=909768 RepID=A0AA36P3I2_ACINO|nr:hypothetical protein PA3_34330 [Acinetobacter pittii]CDI28090.1 hypothetical protein APICBIBUN_P2_15367 [Acinetobacter pittii 42F]CDI28592.1 hypothetical protein ANICBIBUN_P2_20023 [Acinetobacter nosocomialis 28F]